MSGEKRHLLTLNLSERLYNAIAAEAHRRQVSKDDVIMGALEQFQRQPPRPTRMGLALVVLMFLALILVGIAILQG